MKAAGEPEDHEQKQNQPSGRPTRVSVARVRPAASAESQYQENDENDEEHAPETAFLGPAARERPEPKNLPTSRWSTELGYWR
jgi:hypothetical protein